MVLGDRVKSQGDLMKSIATCARVYFSKSVQRLTEILYVPTQTGSHELGDQYCGAKKKKGLYMVFFQFRRGTSKQK